MEKIKRKENLFIIKKESKEKKYKKTSVSKKLSLRKSKDTKRSKFPETTYRENMAIVVSKMRFLLHKTMFIELTHTQATSKIDF
ncbi:MAG TPA: hypothetical protein VGM34_01555 [Chlamydiales bacterium]|jgi:hypothetical protein